ncbi:MAG: alpha/beta hydrolase [Anaerolineales bacterium]|nr:alpha/beta hydrolase [Anaerolineales bacterium]
MSDRTRVLIALCLILGLAAGCSLPVEFLAPAQPAPSATAAPTATEPPIPTATRTATVTPTSTITPTPTATEIVFSFGRELTIDYLRAQEFTGSKIVFEQKLADRSNYHRYLASYLSEGNRIYGLLTIPFGDPPEGGFKAIVFNHGYIPPGVYRTTERYVAYVDYLARSGFVVFKIDYRGHGDSEGEAAGSYFHPGYTIDAINAFKSLQKMENVDPDGIGMWGHSMAGNVTLRAMLVEPEIKAGVIWAGAVYSYADLVEYGITDSTYRPPPTLTPASGEEESPLRFSDNIFEIYGRPDLSEPYWQAVSLTMNLDYLSSPLQIHHAEDDTVVSIAYSYELAESLLALGKRYEFYVYESGGHNLESSAFLPALQRTVAFFEDNL